MNVDEVKTADCRQRSLLRETDNPQIVEIELSTQLTRDHYEQLSVELERRIEAHGKLRLLVILHEFHGWRLAALWQDVKFDLRHFTHFERIAVVGENRWQEWMASFCMPFTTGELRFFHQGQIEGARAWLREAGE
jgi:hypothetical protein